MLTRPFWAVAPRPPADIALAWPIRHSAGAWILECASALAGVGAVELVAASRIGLRLSRNPTNGDRCLPASHNGTLTTDRGAIGEAQRHRGRP